MIFLFHLLLVPSMAETFEYPPAFVQRRPLDYERAGVRPLLLRLHHYFFLTRLKMVLKTVLSMEYTPFLLAGVQSELVSASIDHQLYCSISYCRPICSSAMGPALQSA